VSGVLYDDIDAAVIPALCAMQSLRVTAVSLVALA
jgi:hypothetical protein